MKKQTYDLEERLVEYSVRIIKIVEQLPNTKTGNHVAGQLLRSGTSPYPNHGEAQAAESPKDFIHKLRISLLDVCLLIRCWTFDVRCSSFKTTPYGINVTCECLQNNLALMGARYALCLLAWILYCNVSWVILPRYGSSPVFSKGRYLNPFIIIIIVIIINQIRSTKIGVTSNRPKPGFPI